MSDLSNRLSSPTILQFHLPLLEPGILDQRYMRVLSMLEHELGTLELQSLSRLITNMIAAITALSQQRFGILPAPA